MRLLKTLLLSASYISIVSGTLLAQPKPTEPQPASPPAKTATPPTANTPTGPASPPATGPAAPLPAPTGPGNEAPMGPTGPAEQAPTAPPDPSAATNMLEPSANEPTVNLSDANDLIGKKIVRLQFRGNRKIEDDAMRANLSLQAGQPLELEKSRNDIRALWRLKFFSDVQIYAEASGDGVLVTIAVQERPSIRKVYISGNSELELDKINEVLDLKRDEIIDITKVKQNRDKIREAYVDKGYSLAQVTYQLKPVNEAEVDVWYIVEERAKVQIRQVSFIGNRAISDDELRNVIRTRKVSPLSAINDFGIFKQEYFDQDVQIIMAYYLDHGFVNVKLGEPRLRLSRDKRYMYISIPVEEGPVFHVSSIDFKGDLLGDKAEYHKRLQTKPGDKYQHSKVGQDINRLVDHYKDQGYAYVNVNVERPIDQDKRTVGLNFQIEKGKKVYFERINVRGNGKTRDKVIRREMKISEGDLYNQTNLDISRRRIQALGFFDPNDGVKVSTEKGSTDEFIEVNVEVSERPTGTFQIGAGFSSQENFIAQAQISQNNLFGRGQTLTLQAQLSSLRQLFLLRFVEPYFLDTQWTFAFDLFNQSRGFGFYSRNSSGGTLTWGYPINFETRAFLTYKLEDISVSSGQRGFSNFGALREPVEAESVANLYRGGTSSSIRAAISYDSRDDRLYSTTSGWYHNLFFEVADKFTASENIFMRYGGFSRYYKKLFGPFVLKLNGEVGVTVSRDPLGVPIIERYLIGGIFDVRGFRPRSLGPVLRVSQPGDVGQPLGQIPLGGNLQIIWNSEVEFPLFEKLQISGVMFVDAGNAYNLEKRYCSGSAETTGLSPKFDPCFEFPRSITEGLRWSTGFGFRWLSPIGPLRFEWGIPLDRQPGEDPLVFEFTIGNFF